MLPWSSRRSAVETAPTATVADVGTDWGWVSSLAGDGSGRVLDERRRAVGVRWGPAGCPLVALLTTPCRCPASTWAKAHPFWSG